MKPVILLLMAATLKAVPTEEPSIEVFMPAAEGAEMLAAYQRARLIVSEAYSEIGVRLVFRPIAAAPSGCDKTPTKRMIVVSFQRGPAMHMSKEVLAYAKPHDKNGPCVTLLQDRIETRVRMNPSRSAFLLGHVLAHEIGHVLQQVARHSDSGLMKAYWSNREMMSMARQRLRFTDFDVKLIRGNLRQENRDTKEEPSEPFLWTAIRVVLDAGRMQ